MGSMTVEIPSDIAARIAAELEAGTFQSETDIILAGLEALLEDEGDVEGWLRNQVVARCREMAADPSRAIPIADVEQHLRERTRDLA